MTVNKYLNKVAKLFDSKHRQCEKKKHCLQEALKKLRKRKQVLKKQIKQERSDKAKKKLEKELEVITTQQKKGLQLLKELRKD